MAKTKKVIKRYRSKGRYSANIQEINNQSLQATAGSWFGTQTLATNPSQSTLGVSQTYTIKNVEINFTLEGHTGESSQNVEAVTAYIMYVPQGMTISSSYHLDHPEYILTYKYLGSPSIEYTPQSGTPVTQNYQPFKIRSRLARRLQTGDGIILYIKGTNISNSTVTLNLSGLVRWWTKAN